MKNLPFSRSRRVLLQGSALGLAAMVGAALPARLRAKDADLPRLSEDDATGKALKYTHDATKSEDRKDAKAFCHNCRYFKGKPDDAWARCDLFPGKLVAGKGWCNVWAAKT